MNTVSEPRPNAGLACVFCNAHAPVDHEESWHQIGELPSGTPVYARGDGWRLIDGLTFCPPPRDPYQPDHFSVYPLSRLLAATGAEVHLASDR